MVNLHKNLPLDGWTGGQFSLLRILIGVHLLILFTTALANLNDSIYSDLAFGHIPNALNPYLWTAAPVPHSLLLGISAIFSLCLAIGYGVRVVAFPLFYLLLAASGLYLPLGDFDADVYGLIFLFFCFTRPSPWGSFDGHTNGINYSWGVSPKTVELIWAGCAFIYLQDLFYSFSWNLLELSSFRSAQLLVLLESTFVLTFWIKSSRIFLWFCSVIIAFLGFGDSMLYLCLFLFNPGWISTSGRPGTILFDGNCGLCHRWVQFVLSENTSPDKYKFAPLQLASNELEGRVGANISQLDTMFIIGPDKHLLQKSTAVVYILLSLGGIWRLAGELFKLVPISIRDRVYDLIARKRHIIFSKPDSLCPIVPTELNNRFT